MPCPVTSPFLRCFSPFCLFPGPFPPPISFASRTSPHITSSSLRLSPSKPRCRFPSLVVNFAGPDRVGSERSSDSATLSIMPESHESSIAEGENAVSMMDKSTFLAGLMPKKEIGADRFLAKYPEFDGRGIVIAIFDSGVDPAAAGLQTTSDGKPKILDILDCTGSGDIDTSTIVKADKGGFLKSASGRQLKVNEAWKNPSGEWRIGCKLAYELFTSTLVSRLKEERKKKWDEKHTEAITDALRQLTAFDLEHPKPSDASLKKKREDLQNRVELLQNLSECFSGKSSTKSKCSGAKLQVYEDKGPMIDAVVWNDGEVWRVALDTQEMDESGGGKLADFSPLTNYRFERKYGIFSNLDACSFVTNVYDNGNILSIVTDCSPHGTHVAGITSAYHPEEPLLCGVAPGAQLISCKIGDSRLGSMETGTGLTRALIAAVENKCHLINMSYGEPTSAPDYGRFVELANEVVNKFGIIFVSSAGNAGPSLSTVGAPGGTSSSIIGIGAYVSPVMAAAAHSIVEPPSEGLQYTWSSRGPTADGDLGVCLSAPGAAVAPVPQWTLQRRMLMNGTSMSSPCACGGIALVLSAMKAESQAICPWSVRKALENTALSVSNDPEEILTTGYGLLQVDKAYEYLQRCSDRPAVFYQVVLNRSGNSGNPFRGVYLREAFDCCQASEWTVQVKPNFHEDADKLELIVPFEERVQLESSEPGWVRCPEYVLLTHNGRTFNIVVDPSHLAPGVHCAQVHGIDCDAPWRGPLFQIPVTVLKPIDMTPKPTSIIFSGLTFIPGHIERRFIAVPVGATWAEATVRAGGFDTPRRFYANAVQLISKKRPVVSDSSFVLPGPSFKSLTFPIEGGVTMEFTVAQFWSSGIGSNVPAIVDVEIEFHGLVGNRSDISLNGGDVITRIDVKSVLGVEKLSPVARLNTVRIPYRPFESKLQALPSDRDRLPNGRQILSLTLFYKFNLGDACKITPRFPVLNKRVYDNEFESQFYMISDINKRVYAMGDIYPKGVQLSKGDYTLRLHLRHDNIQYLEKLKKAVIFIDKKLEEKNSIQLDFYSCIDGGITGSHNLKPLTLMCGESQTFYVTSPAEDEFPKDVPIGTILVGNITYGRVQLGNSKGDKGGEACPSSYRVTCVVPPLAKTEEMSKDKNEGSAKKTPNQLLEEQVRDAKIKFLSGLSRESQEERKEWNEVASTLKTEYPKHLPLLSEILTKISASQCKEDGKAGTEEVIAAADEVINIIDQEALAKFFGVKREAEETDAVLLKQEMEMQRDALADALYRKAIAIAELEDVSLLETILNEESAAVDETHDGKSTFDSESSSVEHQGNGADALTTVDEKTNDADNAKDQFEETYWELRKWIDISSAKYSFLVVLHEKRCGRLGTAIKVLIEMIHNDGKPPKKNLYNLQVKLLQEIGWLHWAAYAKKSVLVLFPHGLPLF